MDGALNLTAIATVDEGSYDLSRVDIETLTSNETMKKFLKYLLSQRHVIYDWGHHCFFVSVEPFLVDYEKKKITTADRQRKIEDDNWIMCDPENLHTLLADVFEGAWGPTATDTILRMESSGVKVDLCGTSKFGPKNPQKFLEDLRQRIKK